MLELFDQPQSRYSVMQEIYTKFRVRQVVVVGIEVEIPVTVDPAQACSSSINLSPQL